MIHQSDNDEIKDGPINLYDQINAIHYKELPDIINNKANTTNATNTTNAYVFNNVNHANIISARSRSMDDDDHAKDDFVLTFVNNTANTMIFNTTDITTVIFFRTIDDAINEAVNINRTNSTNAGNDDTDTLYDDATAQLLLQNDVQILSFYKSYISMVNTTTGNTLNTLQATQSKTFNRSYITLFYIAMIIFLYDDFDQFNDYIMALNDIIQPIAQGSHYFLSLITNDPLNTILLNTLYYHTILLMMVYYCVLFAIAHWNTTFYIHCLFMLLTFGICIFDVIYINTILIGTSNNELGHRSLPCDINTNVNHSVLDNDDTIIQLLLPNVLATIKYGGNNHNIILLFNAIFSCTSNGDDPFIHSIITMKMIYYLIFRSIQMTFCRSHITIGIHLFNIITQFNNYMVYFIHNIIHSMLYFILNELIHILHIILAFNDDDAIHPQYNSHYQCNLKNKSINITFIKNKHDSSSLNAHCYLPSPELSACNIIFEASPVFVYGVPFQSCVFSILFYFTIYYLISPLNDNNYVAIFNDIMPPRYDTIALPLSLMFDTSATTCGYNNANTLNTTHYPLQSLNKQYFNIFSTNWFINWYYIMHCNIFSIHHVVCWTIQCANIKFHHQVQYMDLLVYYVLYYYFQLIQNPITLISHLHHYNHYSELSTSPIDTWSWYYISCYFEFAPYIYFNFITYNMIYAMYIVWCYINITPSASFISSTAVTHGFNTIASAAILHGFDHSVVAPLIAYSLLLNASLISIAYFALSGAILILTSTVPFISKTVPLVPHVVSDAIFTSIAALKLFAQYTFSTAYLLSIRVCAYLDTRTTYITPTLITLAAALLLQNGIQRQTMSLHCTAYIHITICIVSCYINTWIWYHFCTSTTHIISTLPCTLLDGSLISGGISTLMFAAILAIVPATHISSDANFIPTYFVSAGAILMIVYRGEHMFVTYVPSHLSR